MSAPSIDSDAIDAGPGEITALASGHDAWVVGDEPVVAIDWQGASKLRPVSREMEATMNATDAREAALLTFDQARTRFVDQLRLAPEASLRYLKAGDDYALGGLVYHVNAVLEHYLGVLSTVVAAGSEETSAQDRPGLFEEANARARAGVTPAELRTRLAETARLHDEVRTLLAGVAREDFERKRPVRYEAGADPYPTSPAHVAGWLTGHYEEHVPHVQQLLDSWQASR
jgi:hypothetical protein